LRRNRYRGAELHNIRKLLPFPTRQLVNWDFRDTKYGRNKADAEAHLRFQVSSIIRGFKLMYSSKRPHLSLERLTHNNLYCFIDWLHWQWGSVTIFACKKQKGLGLHYIFLCFAILPTQKRLGIP